MARKKNLKNQTPELKLFTPENINDLENIGELLQTYEASVIINLSKSKCKKDIIMKAVEFLQGFNTSYMTIRYKKVFTKVFVFTSVRNQLL